MSEGEKFFVIINPVSGKGWALTHWDLIEAELIKNGIIFSHTFSAYKGHIKEIVREKIIAGYRRLIIVGGDGSLSEVVNGIFSQEHVNPLSVSAGIIPAGTGNDFCRMHRIPFNYKKAIEMIRPVNAVVHDVGQIIMAGKPAHYFINVAGCGYDGYVAEHVNRFSPDKKSNKAVYLFMVFRYLFSYKPVQVKVTVYDSVLYEGKLFSMAIANCRFNGGGMMPAPDASFNDGLLNITLVKPRNLFTIIFNLYRLFNGTIARHRMVLTAKVSSLNVVSGESDFLEADGESVGSGSFKIKILPGAINIFSGIK